MSLEDSGVSVLTSTAAHYPMWQPEAADAVQVVSIQLLWHDWWVPNLSKYWGLQTNYAFGV